MKEGSDGSELSLQSRGKRRPMNAKSLAAKVGSTSWLHAFHHEVDDAMDASSSEQSEMNSGIPPLDSLQFLVNSGPTVAWMKCTATDKVGLSSSVFPFV